MFFYFNISILISTNSMNAEVCVIGIAHNEVLTQGVFTVQLQVDNGVADVKFYLVEDHVIPVGLIIGSPILRDFEVKFTRNGITMEKIPLCAFVVEHNGKEEYDKEELKFKEGIEKIINNYNPKKDTDETPIFHSPRRISTLEIEAVNKQITDCSALTMTLKKKDLPPPVEENDYRIEQRPGSNMKHADALSRNPLCLIPITETTVRLKKAQDEDEHIGLLKEIIDKEPNRNYVTQNGILYKEKNGTRLAKENADGNYIGMTAFELLFGSKIRYKNDDLAKMIEEENIQKFHEKRHDIKEKAKESIRKIQQENVRNYNKTRKKARLNKTGDLVAVKKIQFSQGSKLYLKYLGPYEVVKEKRNDRYSLRKVGNGEGPINTTSSTDYMKPWIDNKDSSGTDEYAGMAVWD